MDQKMIDERTFQLFLYMYETKVKEIMEEFNAVGRVQKRHPTTKRCAHMRDTNWSFAKSTQGKYGDGQKISSEVVKNGSGRCDDDIIQRSRLAKEFGANSVDDEQKHRCVMEVKDRVPTADILAPCVEQEALTTKRNCINSSNVGDCCSREDCNTKSCLAKTKCGACTFDSRVFLVLLLYISVSCASQSPPMFESSQAVINSTAKSFSACILPPKECPKSGWDKDKHIMCIRGFMHSTCPPGYTYFCDRHESEYLVEGCFLRNICPPGQANDIGFDPVEKKAWLKCTICEEYFIQPLPHDSLTRFRAGCKKMGVPLEIITNKEKMKKVYNGFPTDYDQYTCDSSQGYSDIYHHTLCNISITCVCRKQVTCTTREHPQLLPNGTCDRICAVARDVWNDYACNEYIDKEEPKSIPVTELPITTEQAEVKEDKSEIWTTMASDLVGTNVSQTGSSVHDGSEKPSSHFVWGELTTIVVVLIIIAVILVVFFSVMFFCYPFGNRTGGSTDSEQGTSQNLLTTRNSLDQSTSDASSCSANSSERVTPETVISKSTKNSKCKYFKVVNAENVNVYINSESPEKNGYIQEQGASEERDSDLEDETVKEEKGNEQTYVKEVDEPEDIAQQNIQDLKF